MPWLFQPPTVRTGWPIEDRFWSRVLLDRGQAVLIKDGAVWIQSEYITQDQVAAADYVYYGGHDYWLTQAEHDLLVSLGFAGNITTVDGYGFSGYGTGGFGE